ncbi:structural origins of high-affinity biotin binding To Streptavidin [Lentinula edodes]|uniref:Structural origins of high-affinity biotin binding To Streptavidin n=1 Tax=Lentinula edodes TaxID=5353 RepID=A0A1Q3DZB1_LENED|nr:structural origins of high-affinity biotin binding To Streptavidin [Lentinula edodes]
MTRSLVTLLVLGLSCVSGAPTASESPQVGNQLSMNLETVAPTATLGHIVGELSGTWINELGSTVTLIADLEGGLSGQYNSAVGNALSFYNLTGRFDTLPPAGRGVSVGWVVTWKNKYLNAHSTTTWSGQYFNKSGSETIITQWLLTRSTTPDNVWASTTIGHDEFIRK